MWSNLKLQIKAFKRKYLLKKVSLKLMIGMISLALVGLCGMIFISYVFFVNIKFLNDFFNKESSIHLKNEANKDMSLTDNCYLQTNIVDTGIGIKKDIIDKLFSPFIQTEDIMTRKYEGIGLGLTLVKTYTELHRGTVCVESEVGKGSSFFVWIPYKTI